MLYRPISTLLLVAGLTFPCLAVLAQGGPIPLAPKGTPVQAPPPLGTESISPPADAVQVQELASLNPNEIGLLDDQHGGLGMALWADSSLGLVSKALPLLSNQPGWRSLRALQLRLLESAASLPPGKAPGEPLIELRAGKLAGMGASDATQSLLKMLPSPSMTPILRRLQIDSALLNSDGPGACSLEPAFQAAHQGDNYALELQVFCQFVSGRKQQAALGVDLLRDQKLRDPLFLIAADALGGLPPPARLDGLAEASPLALAMAILAKLPLPEGAIASLPAGYLPAIAKAPGASPEIRLSAAERALQLGIAPAELLRQIIEQMPDQPADAAAAAETGKTAKSRAMIYKAALNQPIPTARGELIQRGLAADPQSAPLLYAPMLISLPASPDLVNGAPAIIRALLLSGKGEAARAWLGNLRADALLGLGHAGQLAALKPLIRLAGLSDSMLNSGDLADWKQARNESAADAAKHSLLLLTLLTAQGDTPPETEWLALLDGNPLITGKVARSALSTGLAAAAAGHKRGETVLYASLCLGDQREAEPAQYAQIIAALRAVGLTDEARGFALELALANGL